MKIYLCTALFLILTGCSASQMQDIEQKVGFASPDPNATTVKIDNNGICTGGTDLTSAQRDQACDAAKLEMQRNKAITDAWNKKLEEQRAQEVQQQILAQKAQETMEAAAKRQVKQDEAHGYHYITIADYQLDAQSMRQGRKLIITGFYEQAGNILTLTRMPTFTAPDQYQIYLLTEHSPRAARKKLISLQQYGPCGSTRVCKLTILGHITSCQLSFMGRAMRDTVCLGVDNIR